MKQFSLKEYLKNPDRKVITRDGRDVRIICTDRNPDRYPVDDYGNYPIIALVQGEFREDVLCYTENGIFLHGSKEPEDLFFSPEKKEGWVNLFKINSTIITGEVYNTEKEAKSAVISSSIYISTVKVEWEE